MAERRDDPMDRTSYDNTGAWDFNSIQHGWDVFDANGDKVGDVSDVNAGYLTVSKGWLFPTERYIPVSAIEGVRQDRVYLNVTKDQVDQQGWDTVPTTTTGGVYSGLDREYGRTAMTDTTTTDRMTTNRMGTTTGTPADESMKLREERLRANKQTVEAGEVGVSKDVVTEQRTMDVPVTHEEVTVERHPVEGRPAAEPIGADDDREIRVPVREERVNAEKEAEVYEEVDVHKRQVTEQQRVSGTVRREEAHIDREGDVNVRGTDTDLTDETDDTRPVI